MTTRTLFDAPQAGHTEMDLIMTKFSNRERDDRTDAAFAAGHYRATGTHCEMATLYFCNVIHGRCDVCGADRVGGVGCFSMLVPTSRLPPDKIA